MTRKLTLGEMVMRSKDDETPSVLEMWVAIHGVEADLVELVQGTACVIEGETRRRELMDAIIGLLGIGTTIGYYYALRTYDAALGIASEVETEEGTEPC
jgi:hypothetical protein